MPSRASTSLLPKFYDNLCRGGNIIVSMPSRASTSLLQKQAYQKRRRKLSCQCPHGLQPHCYGDQKFTPSFPTKKGCQCPHGLQPHCYEVQLFSGCDPYSSCQCPHGLQPHCYTNKSALDALDISVNALTGFNLIATN